MNIKERIKYHYKIWPVNGLGDDFNGLRSNGLYAYSTVATLLRHYPLDKLSDSRILDFGSGTGRLAKLIAKYTKDYICADISPLYLRDCKKELREYKNCQFHEIENNPYLDFIDNYFDFSFSYLSMCAPDKEEFKKNLIEIDRVSKNFSIYIGLIKDYDLGFLSNNDALSNLVCVCNIEELKELFSTENYIFEILKPESEIHSASLFIYKVSDNLDIHLKFGPHVYEKALNETINISSHREVLISLKKFLSISPLQFLKLFKRRLKNLW